MSGVSALCGTSSAAPVSASRSAPPAWAALPLLGTAVRLWSRAGELIRTQIIDPDTSLVLADQTSIGNNSDPVSDTLILEVGWTNEKPHKPVLP
jgi:hypothetical protein